MYRLKRIGLNNITEIEEVRLGEIKRTVITKGLDVDTLVKEWRDAFYDYGKMVVLVEGELLRPMMQCTLSQSKSLEELFYERGVIFEQDSSNR